MVGASKKVQAAGKEGAPRGDVYGDYFDAKEAVHHITGWEKKGREGTMEKRTEKARRVTWYYIELGFRLSKRRRRRGGDEDRTLQNFEKVDPGSRKTRQKNLELKGEEP